jgi:hypothetical protein
MNLFIQLIIKNQIVALVFQLPIFARTVAENVITPSDPFSMEILPGLVISVGVIVLNLLESLVCRFISYENIIELKNVFSEISNNN